MYVFGSKEEPDEPSVVLSDGKTTKLMSTKYARSIDLYCFNGKIPIEIFSNNIVFFLEMELSLYYFYIIIFSY